MGFKALLVRKTHCYLRGVAVSRGDLALFSEIIAILSLIIVVTVSYLSLRNMNRYNSMFDKFSGLIGKDDEGHIVMDERVVAVIDAVGSRMFQSAKMSMLQTLSVDSKKLKGLKGAMAQDVIEEKMPFVEMAGDFMGVNTRAYIKKYPDAIFQLAQIPAVQKFLGGMLSGQGNNPGKRGRM